MASSEEIPPSEEKSLLTPELERRLRGQSVLEDLERRMDEFNECIDQGFKTRLQEIQAKYHLPDDFIHDATLARLKVQTEKLVVEHQLTGQNSDPTLVQLHDFDEILPQLISERAKAVGMSYNLPLEAIHEVKGAYLDAERMYDSGICEPEHGLPGGTGRKDPSMKMPG